MVISGYTINDLAWVTGKSRNAISKNMNVAGSFRSRPGTFKSI